MKIKFIAGPCVIESAELLDTVAQRLVAINERLGADIIFKASFDKARSILQTEDRIEIQRRSITSVDELCNARVNGDLMLLPNAIKAPDALL